MPAELPPIPEHSPRQVGAYKVLESIGRGGMGEVYRGWDTKLNRDVALKALPPELLADERARARFVRETRVACRVVHPYVATVFDVVEDETQLWLVMELIDGRRLDRLLADDQPSTGEVARLGLEIAEALHAIHGAGLVHRDLKPGNVMVTRAGHVKVMDFGVAYPLKVLDAGTPEAAARTTERSLTGDGYGVGTVAYMSPEQVRGGEVDPRSDLFSLGIVLYEAITGEHPFQRESIWATASAIVNEPPGTGPEPRTLTESGPLRQIVLRMLEKDPAMRPQSSGEVVADLQAFVRGEPVPRRARGAEARPRRRAVLVAVLVIAALAGWALVHRTRVPESAARPVVAVLPFEDRTGEPDGRDRGEMLADLLAADLGRGAFRTVDRERLEPILAGLGGDAQKAARAISMVGRLTPARWVVTGNLYKEGESYHAAVAIHTAGSSRETRSFKVAAGSVTALADLARTKLLAAMAPDAARAGRDTRSWPVRDDETALLEQRARRAMRELRYLDAIALVARALESDPDYLPAALLHVRALDAAGYGKRALAAAERALRIARRPGTPSASWSLEAEAVDAGIRDRLDKAIELRRTLAESMPDDPEAWLSLAAALRVGGRLDEARTAGEKAEAFDPKDPRVAIVSAKISVAQGKFEDAHARLKSAESWFAEVGSAVGVATVVQERGNLERARSDNRAAKAAYEDAERRYRDAGFEGGVARAQAASAMAAVLLARFADATSLCEAASRSARSRGDFRLAIEVRNATGAALFSRGETEAAERYLRGAVSDAAQVENDSLKLNPVMNLASLLGGTGRAGEGALLADEALELARARGRRDLECTARTLLADAEYQMGRLAEAIEDYEAAEALAASGHASAEQRFDVLEYLTEALDWTCAADRALDANRRAIEIANKSDQRVLQAYGLLRRAELRGTVGDFQGATVDLDAVEMLLGRDGEELVSLRPRIALARAALDVMAGEPGRAQSALGPIIAEGESTRTHGLEMPARLWKALALLQQGDPKDGARQAERVLASERATVPEQVRARSILARCLAAAGAYGRAAVEAQTALDAGSGVGIPLAVVEAAAVLVSLPSESRPATAAALRERGSRALSACETSVPEAQRAAYRRRADLESLFEALGGS